MRIRQSAAAFLVGGLLLLAAGCSNTRQPAPRKVAVEKTRPLPEVAAGDQNFSSYKPANPYAEIAPGVLMRTVFQAPGPGQSHVEVEDIVVDAGKKGENIKLPGAAFIQVRAGAGTGIAGGKPLALPPGASFTVAQGESFTLQSTSPQPLVLRVQLVKGE